MHTAELQCVDGGIAVQRLSNGSRSFDINSIVCGERSAAINSSEVMCFLNRSFGSPPSEADLTRCNVTGACQSMGVSVSACLTFKKEKEEEG